jgi:hypothetical protein
MTSVEHNDMFILACNKMEIEKEKGRKKIVGSKMACCIEPWAILSQTNKITEMMKWATRWFQMDLRYIIVQDT